MNDEESEEILRHKSWRQLWRTNVNKQKSSAMLLEM